jgi:hypothetical protein
VLGVVLIVAAMLVLGGLGAATFFLRAPPTDEETLWRIDAPLQTHTIVLVDSTDRLKARRRRKLRAVLEQERAGLGQYDHLTILHLNVRRPQEPAILFSRCLPRPPEQTNPLFENARMAQQRWDEDFPGALDSALRSAQSGGPARAWPIITSLRAVAADPDFGAETSNRRLVLMSDLFDHNLEGYSLYAEDAAFSAWRGSSPQDPPGFARVDVRIVPIDRPDHNERQSVALTEYWPAFFDASDVQTVSFDPAP